MAVVSITPSSDSDGSDDDENSVSDDGDKMTVFRGVVLDESEL